MIDHSLPSIIPFIQLPIDTPAQFSLAVGHLGFSPFYRLTLPLPTAACYTSPHVVIGSSYLRRINISPLSRLHISITERNRSFTRNTHHRSFLLPGRWATGAVVSELSNAKQEILVQAYWFTSAPIAKALLSAHERGVKVVVVLDRSQRTARNSSATFLGNAGIPTYIDEKHASAHNKVIIIDQATIITGSFNFTKVAEENNAENLLVIRGDDALVMKYLANFKEHLEHSDRYEGRN